ncbi:MAG: hypothetical protein WBG88_04485 [Mesorhizobium sp.]
MAHAALYDLLPDFGAAPPRASSPAPSARPAPPPETPKVDVEALVARAVADAEAALEARLVAAHEQALATERQKSTEAMQAFLQGVGTEVGEAIAVRIDALETHANERVGTAVARIVGDLLGAGLRERSLRALARTVSDALGDRDALRIGVSGPQSMFKTLQAALGRRATHLDFTEADGFDLTVTLDDTVFETRMAEWAGALAQVLAEDRA